MLYYFVFFMGIFMKALASFCGRKLCVRTLIFSEFFVRYANIVNPVVYGVAVHGI
jgi:hypothetical protein